MTRITLDSWKVYPTAFDASGNCVGRLELAPVLRAFQNAVRVGDRVIVAQIQGLEDDRSFISQAANNAFDAGAVIIAANGNRGPTIGTVSSPANAHKAIGVGSFDVQTLAQESTQSRGPTRDGRIKPDIQAPTNTETASNASDTALRIFGPGTSGATPYAGGAAALARNFLLSVQQPIDPGQVYAYLILAGQQVYPFNNTTGAGPLYLPRLDDVNVVFFGKSLLRTRDRDDIPLNIGAGFNLLDAAIWWPETIQLPGQASEEHIDFDLFLLDPNGATVARSRDNESVFQRARATGAPLAAGRWTLRIAAPYFRVGVEKPVYWAAVAARR